MQTVKNTKKVYISVLKTLKTVFKGPLKIDNLGTKWHTLNHYIIFIKYKKLVRFNPRLNLMHLKSIIAFLVTMYELDSFSKVLVAVGIPQHSEISQIKLYSTVSQFYIIRWLPGMLTSRVIMARDFVRATVAKSPIVRYNLKYMRTTVLKLYNIPDLVILSSLDGIGAIVAKEAVLMRIPTIGLATTQSFPANISFRFFGDTSDLLFIRSFLAVIGLGMRVGQDLYMNNNPLLSESFVNEFKELENFNANKNYFDEYLIGYHDDYLGYKQYSINTSYISYKASFFFYSFKKSNQLKWYFNSLNFFNKLRNKTKLLHKNNIKLILKQLQKKLKKRKKLQDKLKNSKK